MKTRKLHTAVIAVLAFAVTTLAQTVPSYVPPNGLVGYWGFNGNANDQSGNGNNGTVSGATLTTDRNGNANSAYYFSSAGCSTRIDASINTSSIQSSFTLAFWLMRSANGCGSPRIMEFWSGSDSNGTLGFAFHGNSFLPGLDYFTSTTHINNASIGYNQINNNQWTHIVFTCDSSSAKCYQDGVLINTFPSNGNAILSGNAAFGRMNHPANDAFNGKLDDIAIYNRALTQSEITQLYTATSSVQTLCTKTIQSYNVNVGDATHYGSTYVWSISPATPSAVMTGNGTNAITIDWTNVPYGTYTVQTVETNAAGCLSTPVNATINLTQPTAAPSATATQTFCTAATVANLTATGTNLQWFTTATGGTALTATTALTTGNYYVSQTVGLCESNRTVVAVSVNPTLTPTFTQVAPICAGGILSTLPTTSNNGITGTWLPAINNTATTTYTFTPTANQCAETVTMTIDVILFQTPIFTQVAPICSGGILASLPTTSNNGISGTWLPAINNTATTNYTFTPTAGLCAATAAMTIVVNPNVTPTFTQVAPICSGGTLTALPTTSNNGISGIWLPELNNLATTTYTFTPTAGQCANTTTQTITITAPKVTSEISFEAPAATLPNVTIGTQVWTSKNLDVTTYSDGTPIPQVTDPIQWANLTTGAWCYYDNDPVNGAIYGKLYNWYALAGIHDNDSNTPNKILAPLGYHVPSNTEWTTLTDFLGEAAIVGNKMKATTLWQPSSDITNTNSSGFTGLPAGARFNNSTFARISINGYWWSSSEFGYTRAWGRNLSYSNGFAGTSNADKYWGFSVRCLRD